MSKLSQGLLQVYTGEGKGKTMVATGLLERADLVTRMEKVRHPYDAGVPAREGIEY